MKVSLKAKSSNGKSILEVFLDHNRQMEILVGKDYSSATLKRYRTSLLLTRQFIEWKYQTHDLDIKTLNYEFLSQDEFWLKAHRNCSTIQR